MSHKEWEEARKEILGHLSKDDFWNAYNRWNDYVISVNEELPRSAKEVFLELHRAGTGTAYQMYDDRKGREAFKLERDLDSMLQLFGNGK